REERRRRFVQPHAPRALSFGSRATDPRAPRRRAAHQRGSALAQGCHRQEDQEAMIGSAIFDLAFGAALSFVVALAMVSIVRRRIAHPRLACALLVLPFVKGALEIARGIPAGAFFWLRMRGAQQELGTFRAGVGVDMRGPILDCALGAKYGGSTYPRSAA